MTRYILVTVSSSQSRRIEDRIRILSSRLIQYEENSDEFEQIAAELRFASFTLKWQIQAGLKDFPPELDRRAQRPAGGHSKVS